jgi:2-dehydropantoate 2-reductase
MHRHRIGLIGAGPVGSLLATALAHNGASFIWVARSIERRAQLPALALSTADTEASWQLDPALVVENTLELGEVEWLVLAVKAQNVLPLLAELNPYPGRKVLVVANGLHSGPFHLGLLYGGARLDEGTVVTGRRNELMIGPLTVDDHSADLLGDLSAPWLTVNPHSRIETPMWLKLALNCVANPLSALLNLENGALLSLVGSPLVRALLEELALVLHHELSSGESFMPEDLGAMLVKLLTDTAGNSSSMREDLLAGRETEIEYLDLAVVERARLKGVDCPALEHLGRLIQAATNSALL